MDNFERAIQVKIIRTCAMLHNFVLDFDNQTDFDDDDAWKDGPVEKFSILSSKWPSYFIFSLCLNIFMPSKNVSSLALDFAALSFINCNMELPVSSLRDFFAVGAVEVDFFRLTHKKYQKKIRHHLFQT